MQKELRRKVLAIWSCIEILIKIGNLVIDSNSVLCRLWKTHTVRFDHGILNLQSHK
ncbi:hypothetical protein AN958_02051 [Leucoagaricus sp. SymC.cos]|nr:hypothetical protein AN958_02051 [Leucoagaricus sp. SymC.cos]